ncbi:hypothetical protein AQUCO_01700267v1 [Aquilegia coerulea]|uniref:Uncharacterized protein n=1 Tax=Aquilegia coerulea TaxID=218851 RepID=A0A2G5DM06_AQUCA|nr:hypothetical protein AQUCO_01700267v1 [Aquilegia coerulea]
MSTCSYIFFLSISLIFQNTNDKTCLIVKYTIPWIIVYLFSHLNISLYSMCSIKKTFKRSCPMNFVLVYYIHCFDKPHCVYVCSLYPVVTRILNELIVWRLHHCK